jgi:hypothetical protein
MLPGSFEGIPTAKFSGVRNLCGEPRNISFRWGKPYADDWPKARARSAGRIRLRQDYGGTSPKTKGVGGSEPSPPTPRLRRISRTFGESNE